MPRTRKKQGESGVTEGRGGAGKPRGTTPRKPPPRKGGLQTPPGQAPAPDLTAPLAAAREQLEQLRLEWEALTGQLIDLKAVSGDLGRQLSLSTRQDLQELTARSETIGAGLREASHELELLRRQALASQQQLFDEGRAASEGMARDLAAQYQALRFAFDETARDLQLVRQQALGALQESLQLLHRQAQGLGQTFAEADLLLRAEAGQRIRESTAELAQEVDQLLRPAREELSAVRSLLAAFPAELERSRREARRLRRQLRAARQETRRLARGGEGRGEEQAPPGGQPAEGNWLGVTVDPGVVVADVRSGTPAERAGLVRGDVITAVDGEAVYTAVGLRDLVRKHDPGDEIALQLTRGDESREVRARLDEVDLPELGTPS